jgi:CBS domain-containing protein
MTVRAIIRNKLPELVTADEHEVFLTLAERLARNNIGVLVVLDLTGRLLGILSERDLVRGMAKYNSAVFAHTARDLMTQKVHICTPADTEPQIMAQMVERHIRHMPVVDEGKVVGLVSLGDVVRHRLGKLGHRLGEDARPVTESSFGSFSRHLGARSSGPKIG